MELSVSMASTRWFAHALQAGQDISVRLVIWTNPVFCLCTILTDHFVLVRMYGYWNGKPSVRIPEMSVVAGDRSDGWGGSLVHSVLGFGPRVPGSIPNSVCLLRHPHQFWIPMLNKELPSPWGTRVQAESLAPNGASWETLSLRLNRPISAPFLTALLPWRWEEDRNDIHFCAQTRARPSCQPSKSPWTPMVKIVRIQS